MKLSKKLIGVFVAASLIVGTSITAFAAPKSTVGTKVNEASKTVTYAVSNTANQAGEKVTSAVAKESKAGKEAASIVIKGSDVITTLTHGNFQQYVHYAANYLAHHKSLSASSLQTVINDIRDIHSKYPGVTSVADYKKLSAADKAVIRNDVRDAADALGLTVTRSANGSYVVTYSSTGSVIATITK